MYHLLPCILSYRYLLFASASARVPPSHEGPEEVQSLKMTAWGLPTYTYIYICIYQFLPFASASASAFALSWGAWGSAEITIASPGARGIGFDSQMDSWGSKCLGIDFAAVCKPGTNKKRISDHVVVPAPMQMWMQYLHLFLLFVDEQQNKTRLVIISDCLPMSCC